MTALLAGLGLGLSLIIAIGAQNVFVLRQGVRREHVLAVVVVCAVSDALLIAAGIAGIGAVLEAAPWLIGAVRWAGAAFLVGYGLLAARRAWKPAADGLDPSGAASPGSSPASRGSSLSRPGSSGSRRARPAAVATATIGSVVGTAVALTWLNPHVYLDTVFLLGSIASTHGDARWLFGLGAITASIVWFTGLGFGARYLGRWLATPRAWRVLDAGIAVVMIALGVSLVLPH